MALAVVVAVLATTTPASAGWLEDLLVGKPRIVSATSLGARHVRLQLDRTVTQTARDASSYEITGPDVTPLPVLAVAEGDGDSVVLTTGLQAAVPYTVIGVEGASSATFTGSEAQEPRLLSATSLSPTRVRLQLDRPMSDTAADASAYSISRAVGFLSKLLGGKGTVAVTAAELGADRSQVVLTTAEQTAVEHTVAIRDLVVTDQDGRYVDPTASSAVFLGTPHVDASPPRLVSATPRGEREVVLRFDKPMGTSADDPSRYTSSPDLFITGARRLPGLRDVVLTTGPHHAVAYTVTAAVADAGGTLTDPSRRSATFTGLVPVSPDGAGVTSAGSTGNTTVTVQYSEPMGDSALLVQHYTIGRDAPSVEAGGLRVLSARFTDDTRHSVELTTMSQAEVAYRVHVGDLRDITGAPLAEKTVVGGQVTVDPTSAPFLGTPPAVGERVDTDCDGLFDHEESRGWDVEVQLATGAVLTRQVTSDPGRPGTDCGAPAQEDDRDGDGRPDAQDTDGDGLDDATEKASVLDPRDDDTDDDGVTDAAELGEIFSDPTVQDTDGDGLTDGLEVGFFRTSSLLADTDGDQLADGLEITLSNRDPRLADLPRPGLEIGAVDLGLDVRFVDQTGTETRTVEEKEVSATLVQTDEHEFATSEARTIETASKVSQEVGYEVGMKAGTENGIEAKLSFKTTAEQSFSSSFASSFTETSSHETQESYEESLTSTAEQAETANRTREVAGARMQVAVDLQALGDIAFTIRDLQVTAVIQDPDDPTRLTPVATLTPDAEPPDGFALGPLVPERGPIVFSNTQVFPQLVDDLMRNPRGLVLRFSNYDVVDELGRSFAFTSQDINDRTASLVIDYGGSDEDGDGIGDRTESRRVAVHVGRRVDTNGDGVLDDRDRYAAFDADGNHLGVTLRDALATIGLTGYREEEVPTSSLTQEEIDDSYSTYTTGDGFERLFRIRRTAMEEGVAKEWEWITDEGIDQSLGLDSLVLRAGETVTLSFLQDTDEDRLPAVVEALNGCVDRPHDEDGDGFADSKDTDGDGLDDRFELLVGWDVTTEQGSRRVRARCSLADTDGDGLDDGYEAPGARTLDEDGLIRFDTADQPRRDTSGTPDPELGHELLDPITDPTTRDTDRDGLDDETELAGYTVHLISPPHEPGDTVDVRTSPERFDTDGDTGSDGVEARVGGDPTVFDRENFADDDQDGLVNVLEGVVTPRVHTLEVETVSTGPVAGGGPGVCADRCAPGALVTVQAQSDVHVADTDGDGLLDGEERDVHGTNPNVKDTDGDGLTDRQEVEGFVLRDLGLVTTDPLDADTDDDKLLDGHEAERQGFERRVVRVPGKAPYVVVSHPLEPDADLDRLVDGDEAVHGSDPDLWNTDGDNRSDHDEVTLAGGGRRPTVPDFRVQVAFHGFRFPDNKDGEEGPNAGDFRFGVSIRDAQGRLACHDPDPAACEGDEGAHLRPFSSSLDGPHPISLRWCTGEEDQGPCRRGDQTDVIQVGEHTSFDIATVPVDLGSVSRVDDLYEELVLSGSIHELIDQEGPGNDCTIGYPVAGAEPAARGILPGPELEFGTHVVEIDQSVFCGLSGEILNLRLRLSYKAD